MSTQPLERSNGSISLDERIVLTPGTCGGRPRIVGTRIRVEDVYVWYELQGRSADQIVSDFPQLTMFDVYAALAYSWVHRDEMLRQMEVDRAFVEEMMRQNPSRLQEKLRERAGANAADPPLPS